MLRDRGMSDNAITRMLGLMQGIPDLFNLVPKENVKKQHARRAKTIKKIRIAADALHSDHELSHITLLAIRETGQPEYCTNMKFANRPTVSDLLSGLASVIENMRPSTYSTEKTISLESFVSSRVMGVLLCDPHFADSSRPLKETAAICSALLGKQITANSIAHYPGLDEVEPRKRYIKDAE